jgi:hypothetical protein
MIEASSFLFGKFNFPISNLANSVIGKFKSPSIEKVKRIGIEILSNSILSISYSTFVGIIKNPLLSNFVGGAGCMVNGIYLMYKSQIPQRCWKIFCRSHQEQRIEQQKLNVYQIGGFILGLLATTYGYYALGLSYLLILGDEMTEAKFLDEGVVIYYKKTNALREVPLKDKEIPALVDEDEEKVDQIISTFLRCPTSEKVYQAANSKISIKIVLDSGLTDQVLAQNKYGYFDPLKQRIVINRDLHDINKVTVALFELINCVQRGVFKEISREAKNGILNPIEYAKAIEKVEFNSEIIHCQTLKDCIENKYWNFAELNEEHCKRLVETNFEKEWESRIKISPHAKMYMKYWYSHYQLNYCFQDKVSIDTKFCQTDEIYI